MQNQEFFIKYKDNQAVPIDIAFKIDGEKRDRPLSTVAHLVAVYKTAVAPRFDHSSLAELTLHLPEGVGREGLEPSCFDSADSIGTTLDPMCSLAYLVPYNSTSKKLLIIKSKHDNDLNLEIYRGEKRMRPNIQTDKEVESPNFRFIPGEHLFGYYDEYL